MAVDDEFIKSFNDQIAILKNMKEAIDAAITRAEGRLKEVTEGGKSIEEVFKRESPAPEGGGG